MTETGLQDIGEIMYRLGISGGMNILELSMATGIHFEQIREILLNIYQVPFGGILLEPEGLQPDEDVLAMREAELDSRIFWRVDLSSIDRIPVENLEPEERIILGRIINSDDYREFLDEYGKKAAGRSAIFVKGTSSETEKIFNCKHYLNIRKSFIERKKLAIVLNNGENTTGDSAGKTMTEEIEIIPAGMVFHSERQKWFLVAVLENEDVRAFETDDIRVTHVLNKSGSMREFDLNGYLRHCFDFDPSERVKVEVLFENYGNIPQKVRRRLAGRGSISDTGVGYLKYAGCLSGIGEFKRWVLSFGFAARITKPSWLAEEQLDEWRKLVDGYGHLDELQHKAGNACGK